MALVGTGRIELLGKPDIGGRIGMEIFPQHADQRVWLTIQRDGPADDVRITAPPALPEPMTDHRKLWRAGPVFFGCKRPAHGRRRAKDLEECRRNMNALHLLRNVAATH